MKDRKTFEVNFDGLVGPTHNYAGLSRGNLASVSNKKSVSRPKEAALQGLEKMKFLHSLGLKQGVLPPHERPHVRTLRNLGFTGNDHEVIDSAYKTDPILLAICSSASCMWTANAATVTPSADSKDGYIHFTPANLISNPHRAIEVETTSIALKAIFNDSTVFKHHPPLAGGSGMGDEGAANHTRLCQSYGDEGIEIFIYGRHSLDSSRPTPSKYSARQTFEASQTITRSHLIKHSILVQQNPKVIDQGVFHNDVISVGNKGLFLRHEDAFLDTESLVSRLQEFLGDAYQEVVVPRDAMSVEDAVKSYFFNSQLVELPNGSQAMICPLECRENKSVQNFLEKNSGTGKPISEVHFLDVRQSMKNGGGPACLRLRVCMNEDELTSMNSACLFDDGLYTELKTWVNEHYWDELTPADLGDPHLLEECRTALDELTQILKLGSIYDFQN